MIFTGYGAVFMLLFTAGAYATTCYWSFLFEPLLLKWTPQLHSRDINTDIMPTEGRAQGGYQTAPEYTEQPPAYINTQTFSSVPGGAQAPQDIPTQYDYSQLRQQVSQGIEMGVVAPSYQ